MIYKEYHREKERNEKSEIKEIYKRKFHFDKLSENELKKCTEILSKLKCEVGKIVIGQETVLNGLIEGLICNGHILLEGIPGIAKTLIIRALGQASGCNVKRIQFTVDLLPTDIIGITAYTPEKGFEVIKGPIFANFLIADEINRSPPKTQSALIEGMQERIVTIGKIDYQLPEPFFVMATKNPVENIGVYNLPEAQVDRFLFNLIMSYPNNKEEKRILEENITLNKFEDFELKSVVTPSDIIRVQKAVRGVYLSDSIRNYIVSLVELTRNKNFKFSDCIAYGCSPRAGIALFIAAKARALLEGRNFVLPEDVKQVIFNSMRHRIILNYKATIKELTAEEVINALLEEISVE